MVTDSASLKMAFEAAMELFHRMHLQKPPRPQCSAPPGLREVYQRAYEFAFRRAARFDEADDPSLIGVPPELDETPFAKMWSNGNSDGDQFGRVVRSAILIAVRADTQSLASLFWSA